MHGPATYSFIDFAIVTVTVADIRNDARKCLETSVEHYIISLLAGAVEMWHLNKIVTANYKIGCSPPS